MIKITSHSHRLPICHLSCHCCSNATVSSPAPNKVLSLQMKIVAQIPSLKRRIEKFPYAVRRKISLINALPAHSAYICTLVLHLSELK